MCKERVVCRPLQGTLPSTVTYAHSPACLQFRRRRECSTLEADAHKNAQLHRATHPAHPFLTERDEGGGGEEGWGHMPMHLHPEHLQDCRGFTVSSSRMPSRTLLRPRTLRFSILSSRHSSTCLTDALRLGSRLSLCTHTHTHENTHTNAQNQQTECMHARPR